MSEVPVVTVAPRSSAVLAEWRRDTDDEFLQVGATRSAVDRRWSWQVYVSLAEFVRDDPLESQMRDAVAATLRDVPGVTEVAEEDREVWILSGTPDGAELVRSVAQVVDMLAPRALLLLDDLDD